MVAAAPTPHAEICVFFPLFQKLPVRLPYFFGREPWRLWSFWSTWEVILSSALFSWCFDDPCLKL
uniref:Uncharacterized protein n=1 Tax=Manihot esculenta TaxID=3983 RepID=A0A2C9W3T0_MANES